MRIVTYRQSDESRCGVVVGDRLFDTAELAASSGRPEAELGSTRQVLAAGPDAWTALGAAAEGGAAAAVALDQVVLGPPIEDPDKIICLGLNYHDHAEESGMSPPAAPMLFAKYRNSLVGPLEKIVPPGSTAAVDYEAELAVVIGLRAKDVAADQALAHVAGVMAFNDVTARDLQHATSQWTAGKAIDTFAPCGPALVFLDEIEDIQALDIQTRVNGAKVQDGNTANMIFPVAETIEFVSSLMTLEPGDIIATGTPAGVGFSRDPQILLGEGDVVEVEIDGVGLLRNEVVAPLAASAAGAVAGGRAS